MCIRDRDLLEVGHVELGRLGDLGGDDLLGHLDLERYALSRVILVLAASPLERDRRAHRGGLLEVVLVDRDDVDAGLVAAARVRLGDLGLETVSYTHLTLPTSDLV